tara:strand:+ start:1480 stop:2058 length:579 start_codon:yes stop_codon:yes gene_type:complete
MNDEQDPLVPKSSSLPIPPEPVTSDLTRRKTAEKKAEGERRKAWLKAQVEEKLQTDPSFSGIPTYEMRAAYRTLWPRNLNGGEVDSQFNPPAALISQVLKELGLSKGGKKTAKRVKEKPVSVLNAFGLLQTANEHLNGLVEKLENTISSLRGELQDFRDVLGLKKGEGTKHFEKQVAAIQKETNKMISKKRK